MYKFTFLNNFIIPTFTFCELSNETFPHPALDRQNF